ncbi:MAG: serine/threonine protein phosphatase [Pirellulaceae bacterium]|nr:MAG: serine/threonine protein phosphatase [Pirellulaceae bacterium]
MRTIVIGDIHGCSKALIGLLEAIDPGKEDRLIFLGDYVDRGPDSRGVIDILLDVQQRYTATFLLGNHDIMFRGVLTGRDPTLWLQIGGQPTVTSYGGKLTKVDPSHLDFLQQCLPYWESDSHIYVHANYVAALPMDEQPEEALFWEHLSTRLPHPHCSGKHVVCGHTPQMTGDPLHLSYLTCVDTACFAGLWLTAWCAETGQVWQVSREGHLRHRGITARFRRWWWSGASRRDGR